MMKRVRILGCLAAIAILASACGGASRQGAVDELIDEGFQSGTANCIMDAVEAAGFTADDVSDPINPAVEPVVEGSLGGCLTDADIPNLLGVDTIEEARAELAEQISASGAMTTDQADCMMDEVLGQGFALVDIAGFGNGSGAGDVGDALAAAGASCIN